MTPLTFIGTLHCRFTPINELLEVIRNLDPETILIEVQQTDIESNNLNSYPEEMQQIYIYATEMKIPCFGFESNIKDYLKDSQKEQEIIAKQRRIIDLHGWKKCNELQIIEELNSLSKPIIISQKRQFREEQMTKNILSLAQGKTLIITGVGHIPFFQKEFPNAKFPLTPTNSQTV